jgi:hypothetical protein
MSAELCGLACEEIRGKGGQEHDGHRISRAGDQSFWGIGLPSMFMGMGEQPAGSAESFARSVFGGGARKGAGFGWWWHTPEDKLDKMDPDLLVRDTQIYVHTIGRLLTDRVLPFDYAASASTLQAELTALQEAIGGALDLSEVIERAVTLRQKAAVIATLPTGEEAAAARINEMLMAVSRALVPIDYTTGSRFGHDPALPQNSYPVLDPLRRLATAPAGSDEVRFLTVSAAGLQPTRLRPGSGQRRPDRGPGGTLIRARTSLSGSCRSGTSSWPANGRSAVSFSRERRS